MDTFGLSLGEKLFKPINEGIKIEAIMTGLIIFLTEEIILEFASSPTERTEASEISEGIRAMDAATELPANIAARPCSPSVIFASNISFISFLGADIPCERLRYIAASASPAAWNSFCNSGDFDKASSNDTCSSGVIKP